MGVFRWMTGEPTEREKYAAKLALVETEHHVGLPALEPRAGRLYGEALPRGVRMARPYGDRAQTNYWMRPGDVMRMRYQPGQIILGKLGGQALGWLDDRPMVTIAGARAGKTSTVLKPNLLDYPGSMFVLDPKAELARETAAARAARGHAVFVLDPFGQSGIPSASFNVLAELDPDSENIIDDVAAITEALIPEDGGGHANRHWTDSARTLTKGIILFTLTLPPSERNFTTVRELLSLTYPRLVDAVAKAHEAGMPPGREFYVDNSAAVETLTRAMASVEDRFGGILAGIGRRFTNTPPVERGSIFSTAAANTDFFDSAPMRRVSRHSDFSLSALREGRPTAVYLVLPVGRLESHFRWLRLIVQQLCTTLEGYGTYPRDRAPIVMMLEEFAVLGHMSIMERAAAYFPGFGLKLWAVLQDITQLRRNYQNGWETFLGNAGVVQCFANGDEATLEYIQRHRRPDRAVRASHGAVPEQPRPASHDRGIAPGRGAAS